MNYVIDYVINYVIKSLLALCCREQQTENFKTPQKDKEIQVEIYDEEEDPLFDINSKLFVLNIFNK